MAYEKDGEDNEPEELESGDEKDDSCVDLAEALLADLVAKKANPDVIEKVKGIVEELEQEYGEDGEEDGENDGGNDGENDGKDYEGMKADEMGDHLRKKGVIIGLRFK